MFTVVECVPIPREGSGWPEHLKQSEEEEERGELVTDELMKNTFDYIDEKSSFNGNFSFFESSIGEKSISEDYVGFANDRNYEITDADVTTAATFSTSKVNGRGHGKDKDREKAEPGENVEKEPDMKNEGIDIDRDTVEKDGGRNGGIDKDDERGEDYLSKIGLGVMISGLTMILILVGTLTASTVKLIRKLRM